MRRGFHHAQQRSSSSSSPPPPPPLLPILPRFTTYTSISQWLDALFVQYRDVLTCPKCGHRGSLYKNWTSAPRLASGRPSSDARHRRYDHRGCLNARNFSLSCADFVQYVLSPFLGKAAAATGIPGQGAGSTCVQRETAATLLKGCKLALEALAKHGNRVNEHFSRRIGEARRDQSQLMAALQGGLLVPEEQGVVDEGEQEEGDDQHSNDFHEIGKCSALGSLSEKDQSDPGEASSHGARIAGRAGAMDLLSTLSPPQTENSFCIAIPARRMPRAQVQRSRQSQPQPQQGIRLPVRRSSRKRQRKEYVEDPVPVPRPSRRRRSAASKLKSTSTPSAKSLRLMKPSHYFSNTHGGPGLPKNRRSGVIIRAARAPPPPAEQLPILAPDEQIRQLRAALLAPVGRGQQGTALTISYVNVRSLNAEKWSTIFAALQQAVDASGGHHHHIMILAETWRPRHLMLEQLLAHSDGEEAAPCTWIAASTVPTPPSSEASSGSLPRCNGGLLLLCPPALRSRLVILSITPYSLTFSLALPTAGTTGTQHHRPLIIHSVYLPPSMGSISSFPLLSAFASPPDSLRADVLLGDMNVWYEPQAPLLTGEEDPDRVEEEAEIVLTGYPRARLAVIEEVTRRLGLERVVGVGEEGNMRFRRLNRKGLRIRRRQRGEEVIRGTRPTWSGQEVRAGSDDDDDDDGHGESSSTSAGVAIPALSRNDHAFVRPAVDDDDQEELATTSPFSSSTVSFWRAGIRTDHPLMRLEVTLRS